MPRKVSVTEQIQKPRKMRRHGIPRGAREPEWCGRHKSRVPGFPGFAGFRTTAGQRC